MKFRTIRSGMNVSCRRTSDVFFASVSIVCRPSHVSHHSEIKRQRQKIWSFPLGCRHHRSSGSARDADHLDWTYSTGGSGVQAAPTGRAPKTVRRAPKTDVRSHYRVSTRPNWIESRKLDQCAPPEVGASSAV